MFLIIEPYRRESPWHITKHSKITFKSTLERKVFDVTRVRRPCADNEANRAKQKRVANRPTSVAPNAQMMLSSAAGNLEPV